MSSHPVLQIQDEIQDLTSMNDFHPILEALILYLPQHQELAQM